MSEKKSYQSWTISDEFWERIQEDIPKAERDPKKNYVHAPGQGRKPMPARKALEGYSMCCERAVNGKPCPGNMAAGAPYIGRSKSGLQRAFLKKYGQKVWNSTMNWKESAGSGKVWTAVW